MRQYKIDDTPIPGYRLTRFLGVGGYGQVWAAAGPHAMDYALKILSVTGTRGGKELRGVGLVKKLRHPNLVPLYGYWLKDEFDNHIDGAFSETQSLLGDATELIIAMGLGEKSLAERLEEAKKEGLAGIPIEELLDYLTGAAKAIDFLNQPVHQFGSGPGVSIQHCDIKPGNLLIVGNEIQVCDYGLARVISPDVRVTAATGAGTQAYSAPELLANRPSDRTDQYSLAISYYELRTGKLPFAENEALHAHIKGDLDFGLVAPAEQAVLQRAAHVDPEKRYPKAGTFIHALREATKVGGGSGIPGGSGSGSTPSGGGQAVFDDRIRAGAELVPDYKLVRLLGRGGYGEVWEARGPGQVRCALKIVRNIEGTQGQQEYRSLKLMLELEHERLIHLRGFWCLAKDGTKIPDEDVGQPGSPDPYGLVMATDLADKSLLQYWQEKQKEGRAGIGIAELVRFIRQSAEAIDYLNDRDIIHRDIKPENILLTKDLKVRISDFGLAKFIEGAGAAIHQGSVGLTLAYAAPEMFDNRVTRWTDQYALALTYYRLRTGNFPFPNEFGPRQMMLAHTEGRLEFAGVRPEEERVLRKATALEPQSRYPNCLSMVEALEQAHGMSSPSMSLTATRTAEFTIPVRTGNRTPDPRQTLIQEYPQPTSPGADSNTELYAGEVAVTAASDSQVMAELQKAAARQTAPRGDLQATVIPEMLEVVPRPGERPHRAEPTQELDIVFQNSASARRRRRLAYGGGALLAATLLSLGAYLIPRSPPASSAPVGPQARTTSPDDPNSGLLEPNAGKGKINPPPPDPLAILQDAVNKMVAEQLKEGDFAAAARTVQDARLKQASKPWADGIDDQIANQWRATAAGRADKQKQIEEYAKLLTAYPNDGAAKEKKTALETELANKETYDQYHAILKDLSAANLPKTRAALVDLEKQPIPDVQKRIKELLARLDEFDKDRTLPAEMGTLATLADKHTAFAKSSDGEYRPLSELYRELWDNTVQKFVPALDVTKDPAKAAAELGRIASPWGGAARAEAVTELLRTRQRVSDAERVLPTEPAPPDLEAYRKYVAATRSWVEAKNDASADSVAKVIPVRDAPPAAWLSPSRQNRLSEILIDAADTKRQRTDLAAPFSAPDSAYRWLGAAERLASRPNALVTKDQLNRLRVDLALAALTKSPRDLALGRRLTDGLMAKDVLESLQLPIPELVQLWSMHARARDDSPAGRAAANASYSNALKLVRDDLGGVPVRFLAAEIVRPLDRDGGKLLLGEPVGDAVKIPAARLCSDAARTLFRHRDEWTKELGKDDSPLDMALRLLDRAAEMDKKAEYLAWHGLVLFEQPRFGPSDLQRATSDAAEALAADDRYAGGHVLAGSVKARRGRAQPDARDRFKICGEANEQFNKAEALAGKDNRDELVVLYQRAADNDIQLAAASTASLDDMKAHLARAKSRAERLLALEPQRLEIHDTLGCVLEDQAWLVKGSDRFEPQGGTYAQAVGAFEKALGGFGERVKARKDRGRCRYKWAEDKFANRKADEPLDETLLSEAKSDLTDAVNKSPNSNDALEAHFWLAKIERLHCQATDEKSPRRSTFHNAAVAEFETALRLAAELKDQLWGEPIAQEMAVAALAEATRLRDALTPGAPATAAAIDAATKAIDALKLYSEPWRAYLRMLLLPIERKPDTSAYFEEMTRRADAGLGPCRDQDRYIQFLILCKRAEERAFFARAPVGEDFAKALADAQAAAQLAIDARLNPGDRAYAIGMKGLAHARLYLKASGDERDQLRDRAREDLRNALKLAPKHRAAWQWSALLGVIEKKEREQERFTTAQQAAAFFAEPYRLLCEAHLPAKPVNFHEAKIAETVETLRADIEKTAPAYLRQALKGPGVSTADRATWQLALAEMLARSGEADKAAEARTLLESATGTLTEADSKSHTGQIERIRQVLAKPEKK
jgi:serine/threonine protein kinase